MTAARRRLHTGGGRLTTVTGTGRRCQASLQTRTKDLFQPQLDAGTEQTTGDGGLLTERVLP